MNIGIRFLETPKELLFKENMSWNQRRYNFIWPRIPTREPVQRTCPHCLQEITTFQRKRISQYQRCLALGLCCLVFPLLCCWMPLIKDELKDTVHYCPSCKLGVGWYVYHEHNETCTCCGPAGSCASNFFISDSSV